MKFFVIGIDDNKEQELSKEIMRIIQSHAVFSGGTRHQAIVRHLLPENAEWIPITVPLEGVFARYKSYDEVVVFASGDPLFFGFANTIQREMPDAGIVLFPTFNSLQLLAHRLLLPYQEMHIVSLTGRTWQKFDEALIQGYELLGVLTDHKEHTPSRIAERMLDYGYDNYRMTIGECLGNREQEHVSEFELKEVVGKHFANPNNLILQKTRVRPRPFGIPETEFCLLNGRSKMITKMPVRLVSLSLLELRSKSVFWDIGFCTGSISIEAKLQFPHVQVIAFERRTEGADLLAENSRKFGTPGIVPQIGDFTETDLSNLPAPDAVFIGGHGGKMNEIISRVADVLVPNGVIVFNSVSAASRQLFLTAIGRNKLTLGNSITIKINDFNTIEVIQAIKTT